MPTRSRRARRTPARQRRPLSHVLTTTRKGSRRHAHPARSACRPACLYTAARGCPPDRRVRLRCRWAHRPARVPGDDAARGLRLPRRRRPPALRAAPARRDPPIRRRDRPLPRGTGRQARRRRLQLGDCGRAPGSAAHALRPRARCDPTGGAGSRPRHAQPPRRPARDRGDGGERALRDADPRRSTPASRSCRSRARGSCR